ncbi:MAG: ATP-dependent endonuclease [Acidobacteria bacterium]|nr:ATP-dependent endonuclease [Acidobacteriota bacterium]
MKLLHLKIHNYRSIRELELAIPDLLVFLGPNNHGKSNILSALEFAHLPSAKPVRGDFFAFRPEGDSTLWVEMTFGDLTEQEQTTFQKYMRNDRSVRIRKSARLQEGEAVEISYNGYVQEPQQWWLQSPAAERLSNRDLIEAEAKNVPELSALLEGKGKISKQRVREFQEDYIHAHRATLSFSEALEDGPLLGTKNVAGGILPEFYLVPAVRDLSDEAKVKGTTIFGKLLQRAVRDMAERDPRFVELRTQLATLVGELNLRPEGPREQASALGQIESSLSSELSSWNVQVSIEVTPPDIEKIFELGTELHLDDGLKTLAERKGHGLQRAVLFALFRAWAQVLRSTREGAQTTARQASDSAYFAIEEPELFLHPHAQRQLRTSLCEIADAPHHQVFICTHSTYFIDMEQYRQLAVATKPSVEAGTQIRQCTCDLFQGPDEAERKRRFHMAYWVNPDRGELFFARKVALTEGETEKVLFPFLAKKMGCLDPNVSIIDCGSKFNMPLYITILNAFRIPYVVVHDEDPLPDPIPADWSPEKRATRQRLFQANQDIAGLLDANLGRVEVLCPDFEGVGGISHTQADRKGKAIAALDHFDPMAAEQFPQRITEVTRRVYGVD